MAVEGRGEQEEGRREKAGGSAAGSATSEQQGGLHRRLLEEGTGSGRLGNSNGSDNSNGSSSSSRLQMGSEGGLRARHVIPVGHPRALQQLWYELADARFLMVDFSYPEERAANIERDVIVPYASSLPLYADDLPRFTACTVQGSAEGGKGWLWNTAFAAWSKSRPTLAFFRGCSDPLEVRLEMEDGGGRGGWMERNPQ